MPITDVKEDWEKATLIRSPGKLSATRGFTVVFDTRDNPIQRPLLANEAPGVPHYGEFHPYSSYLWVDNKTVMARSPILFDVLIHYTSADISPNGTKPIAPWEEKRVLRWGSVVSNEKIDMDIKGNPILNSAKQSPDPPLTEDFYDTTLTISENKKSFDSRLAAEYKNTVNADTFYGYPPGSVICTEYAAESAWYNDTQYWKITKEFRIRLPILKGTKGWTRRLLDEGFKVLAEPNVLPTDTSIRIVDSQQNPISEPALLDGKGQLLEPSPEGSPQKGVYLTYETKKEVSFSKLA